MRRDSPSVFKSEGGLHSIKQCDAVSVALLLMLLIELCGDHVCGEH